MEEEEAMRVVEEETLYAAKVLPRGLAPNDHETEAHKEAHRRTEALGAGFAPRGGGPQGPREPPSSAGSATLLLLLHHHYHLLLLRPTRFAACRHRCFCCRRSACFAPSFSSSRRRSSGRSISERSASLRISSASPVAADTSEAEPRVASERMKTRGLDSEFMRMRSPNTFINKVNLMP